MENLNIKNYKFLIKQYVTKKVTIEYFEKEYISLFRRFRDNEIHLEDDVSDIISVLFTDLDCYCGDPKLRDKDDIDEGELLERAKLALKQLQ